MYFLKSDLLFKSYETKQIKEDRLFSMHTLHFYKIYQGRYFVCKTNSFPRKAHDWMPDKW